MAKKYKIYQYVNKDGDVRTTISKPKGNVYGLDEEIFKDKSTRDKYFKIYRSNDTY